MVKHAKTAAQQPLWYRDAWKTVNINLKRESDAWNGNPPLAPGQWTYRKYRYADGRVHRDTILVIFYADPETGDIHIVGGAVILRRGDVFAYIGHTNPAERARDIERDALGIVWGNNLMRVLQDLKQQFSRPLDLLRNADSAVDAQVQEQHAIAG